MKPLVALTVVAVAVALVVGQEQHETCLLWKDLAKDLSNNGSQMTCISNNSHLCTSVDCQGNYNYKSWVLPGQEMEVYYCVGIWLHHCDNPVSLEIYLEIPHFRVNYTHRVSHNEMLPVPGMNFDMGIGQSQGYFHFQMVRNGDNLTFGLQAWVKLTIASGRVMWPEGLRKTIIPPETIPVPPCKNSSDIPHPARPPCNPGSRPHVTPLPSLPTPSPSLDIIHPPTAPSKTYQRNCSGNDPDECEELEACNLQTKKCECDPDFYYDAIARTCLTRNKLGQTCNPLVPVPCGPNEECGPTSKTCRCQIGFEFNHQRQICTYIVKEPYVPTAPSHNHVIPARGGAGYIIPGAQKAEPAAASTPAGAIVGAVIGGVLLIAAVFAVILFLRNRRQRSSTDRSILLINDEAEIM